uniref:bifunctional diguanylate cyclase/phosphodiesterase n=1 Tax=uncultured Massilia sp. TaxID=169973 RepID=UPI002584F990
HRAAIERVVRHGETVVSNLAAAPSHGAPAFGVYVPVHGATGSTGKGTADITGVLAVAIPSTNLSAMLAGRQLPPGWLATVFDRGGIIAGRSRNATRFVGQPARERLLQAFARQPSGVLETVSRDGVPNLTAFARSPRTGYTAIIGVPLAELTAPLWRKLGHVAALALLLGSAGLLLARHMSRRIAGSIQALTEPAAALGRGEALAVPQVALAEAAEVGAAIERAAALLRERDAVLGAQREELQQFKFFVEHANEMLLLLDERGRIRYANRMAAERLGYTSAELLEMTLYRIDPHATPQQLAAVFARYRTNSPPPFERIYRCRDGAEIPVEITATVLEHGGEWLVHVIPRDIRERRQAEQALRWAAMHDPLTRLANRTQASGFLEDALEKARAGAPGGALLFVDLDRFKPVNDVHGHEVGDAVLAEIARRLRSCAAPGDLLARIGGDEFMLVARCVPGAPCEARERAAAILAAVAQPLRIGKLDVALSASIGISRFPEDGLNPDAVVHAADMAMLQAKGKGRAGYVFYSAEMGAQAQFTLDVERRLQSALDGDGDGLRLHYQPIVNLATGAVEGVEALLRLEDGVAPPVGPATFVPVAESCGLIAPLGEWVARAACAQLADWHGRGLPLSVSINVSPLQFRRSGFAAFVRRLLAASGIAPRRVMIEVTESAVMENLAEAIAVLQEIKALGVKIALDDFGTGYSSLASLSTLPLDKLKIDQSFVRRIGSDRASRAVIDAVIALSRSLDLELVAEGIETEAALRYLRERGCHLGQGYHFSRPLPLAELEAWCAGQVLREAQALPVQEPAHGLRRLH